MTAPGPALTRVATQLRDGGPASVSGLARALALSRTAVENAVTELAALDLVVDAPRPASRGAGRPARRLAFPAGAGAVAGVDVGTASIRVVLADLAGRVLARRTVSGFDLITRPAERWAGLVDGVTGLLTEAGFDRGALRAVGVSVPGLVDDAGRVIISSIIPDWSGAVLGDQLSEAFGCPVAVDNDVRLAAVAEHHLGAARLVDDLLYVSVGNRIAMGLVLGGQPRRGVHHAAGEVGHLAFGDLGGPTGRLSWRRAPTAAEVFRLAAAGDAEANTEIDAFIGALARGIATVAMTVDPAMIIIGGGLSLARDQVIDPLRHDLHRVIGLPIALPVVGGLLGADASVHGSLVHAYTRHRRAVYGLDGLPVPTVRTAAVDEPDAAQPADLEQGTTLGR
ncbi:ROK family transcriptional regulator [Microlunatus parietis]|uniref:Putative NBD/HSP70 family sugar kinase n=1 Tax=Microlunatus parietis TaxID=682979 RepID=A0A7Y9IBJ2_9ACTN|nr:ROK family protein [Microlunatus parietis]NYE73886.1 putative NBD/HSP70 family sugar kinase [Microlunatus parietis]